LYAKNIMFACSLPMSTSTWHSDHHNGPGRYMSGELKTENINKEKAPTRKSHHPAKITQLSHQIQLHSRKILVKEIRFFYESAKTLKTEDPRRLQFTLECNNQQPRLLPETSRRV
jgi:hypothetical protein